MQPLHPARAGASIAALCLLVPGPVQASPSVDDPVPPLKLQSWDHDSATWLDEEDPMPLDVSHGVTKFRFVGDPLELAGSWVTVAFTLSIVDESFFDIPGYAYSEAILSQPTPVALSSIVPNPEGHDYTAMPQVELNPWQFFDKVYEGAIDAPDTWGCRDLLLPCAETSAVAFDLDYPNWEESTSEWWGNLHSYRAPNDYISLDVLVTVLMKEQFAHAGYPQPSQQFITDAYTKGLRIAAQPAGVIGDDVTPGMVPTTDNLLVDDDIPGLILSQNASKWKTSLQLGYQLGIAATGRPHLPNGPFSGGTMHSIVSPGGTATTPATRMFGNPKLRVKRDGVPAVIYTLALEESDTPGYGRFTWPDNAVQGTYREQSMINDFGLTPLDVNDRNTYFVQ